MKKTGKHFLKEKETETENNQKTCMDIAMSRINLLELTLQEIKLLTEIHQYGNTEINFKIIKEKINEML